LIIFTDRILLVIENTVILGYIVYKFQLQIEALLIRTRLFDRTEINVHLVGDKQPIILDSPIISNDHIIMLNDIIISVSIYIKTEHFLGLATSEEILIILELFLLLDLVVIFAADFTDMDAIFVFKTGPELLRLPFVDDTFLFML